MKLTIPNTFCLVSLFFLGISGIHCTKYLDAKPDKKLVVPGNLQDLQAMLDNYIRLNWNAPSAGETAADDYYLTDTDWQSITSESQRRAYLWAGEYLFDTYPNDWGRCYNIVYYANTVLDRLPEIGQTPGNAAEWGHVRGQALFLRGFWLLQAAFLWSKAYDPATAQTDLGIPLRLDPDFNSPSTRSTVQKTYDQIIRDVKESIPLLPKVPVHSMRAGKPAAYALLARTYMSMRDYAKAGAYADSCLQLYNELLDYNALNAAATYPIQAFNSEVLFHLEMPVPATIINSRAKIDSLLYQSYAADDLRKKVFFSANGNGSYKFKGSYVGGAILFAGLATDEVYLMRAEANARTGNTTSAMSDLNTLLAKRWKSGTFVPLTANDAPEALSKILGERRKELLMRGLRWMDLKRLNKEPEFAKTLTRIIDGETYTLPPNDPGYALPIPETIIELTGMPQNPK